MKTFKQFLTEAELQSVAQSTSPSPTPTGLPPGHTGTEQHGPPSPPPTRRTDEPPGPMDNEPSPGEYKDFEKYRRDWWRWFQQLPNKIIDWENFGLEDLERYERQIREAWEDGQRQLRDMRERQKPERYA